MSERILYFTAANVPTEAEQAAIDRLEALAASPYSINIRSAATESTMPDEEDCDYVAGSVPTEYSGVTLFDEDGEISEDKPIGFSVIPSSGSLDHSDGDTLQLYPVGIEGATAADVALVEISEESVVYVSDNTDVATVSADGLVDTAGAGSCTVTATYTYATGKTVTAESAITVTA